MFRFLKKKKQPDPTGIIEELWESRFSSFGRSDDKIRFARETSDGYQSRLQDHEYQLILERSNLFAWAENNHYRYRDFCLDADISFSEGNPYSAAGFIFRKMNQFTYYYFLVSNHGYFRFDVVFNDNPIPIIAWTPCEIEGSEVSVRIIARDTRFSFHINNEWVAEIDDEHVETGTFAFAAQNYDEGESASFSLKAVRIESRAIEVELLHERWTSLVSIDPSRRVTVATTLRDMGQFSAALIQIKKAAKDSPASAKELYLAADCLVHLGMDDEALTALDKCLDNEPENVEALTAKAHVLYRLDKYEELKNYLHEENGLMENVSDSVTTAVLLNLLGNAEHATGSWGKAATAYSKAATGDPDVPLYPLNAARSYEMDANIDAALKMYVESAQALFRSESYEEINYILGKIRELEPGNMQADVIEGKILFHEGDLLNAYRKFDGLISADTSDSSVWFLQGLIAVASGDDNQALKLISKAVEIEPLFPTYRFKEAETRMRLGLDAREAIETAVAYGADDAWIMNLAGQYWISSGEYDRAIHVLEKGIHIASEEPDIQLNLAEAKYRSGDVIGALETTAGLDDMAAARNFRGNLHAERKEYDDAIDEYEIAIRLEPEVVEYRENCAAACIEADRFHRADELVGRLADTAPSARVFNLIGQAATAKTEFTRAETAFREGLKFDPSDRNLQGNLADLLVTLLRYAEARELMATIEQNSGLSSREKEINRRIIAATMTILRCADCDLTWTVPKNIPTQGRLVLKGQPPDSCPAGECTECGKVYCVACAQKHLKDSRFMCADCDVSLKLSSDAIRYAVKEAVEDLEQH